MINVTVIGGGLAGLVAAIECAERGCVVELHEATQRFGGRARSLVHEDFVVNQGPHALYADGLAWRWLADRELVPPVTGISAAGIRFRQNGRLHRVPWPILRALRGLRGDAPAGVDFRTWAVSRVGEETAEAAIGLLTLTLLDGDPGRYSAASVHEVFKRITKRNVVRYVIGGWSVLVAGLVERARSLGVQCHLGSRVDALPDGPAIVATAPRAAERLLGIEPPAAPAQKVALLNLGLPALGRRSAKAVFDLDEGVYLARYSAIDRSLAPKGFDLVQCAAGLRPGEEPAAARARMRDVVDAVLGVGWSDLTVFETEATVASAGARDLPGTTWADRPAVEQPDGVLLAGDWVAAPGLLAEISFASSRRAAEVVVARHGVGIDTVGGNPGGAVRPA